MDRITYLAFGLFMLLAAPGDAGALVASAEPAEGSCGNYGVIVQVAALGTNRTCSGAESCENQGIIVAAALVGGNEYCADGQCDNDGVVALVGPTRSCEGSGAAVVCAADACVVVPDGPGVQQAVGGASPCGVVTDPVCWTVRLACTLIFNGTSQQRDVAVEPAHPCSSCHPGQNCTGELALEPVVRWREVANDRCSEECAMTRACAANTCAVPGRREGALVDATEVGH